MNNHLNNLILLMLLLFFAACSRFADKNEDRPPQTAFAPDSLWTPTGSEELDSLLQLASTAKLDTNLVSLYADIGDEYYYYQNDFQKAKEYYLKTNTLSRELGWNEGCYLYAAGYTNILNIEGLMDSSIVIHQQVLELAKNEMNELRIAIISSHLGNCYNYKRWSETALKYYNDALPVFEKRGEKFRLAHLYNLMGVVYGYLDLNDEKIVYCEKALEIFNEKPDTMNRAHVLNNYAVAITKRKEYEKAENCLLEAQRIYTLHNNKYNLIPVYSNLNEIAQKKYDFDKSEIYTNKMIELAKEFDDIESLSISQRSLGYIEQHRGNFNQSEKHVKEALRIAVEYDLPEEIMKCYKNLSVLAIARLDFRNQLLYEEKSDSIKNALVTETTRQYAKEMEAKYETEKKQLEIERQQGVIIRQNMQRSLLAGGIAVLAVFLALLWYMLRLRSRRNRALAEMNATKDKFFSIISHDLKNPAISQRNAIKLLVKNDRLWDADTLTEYYAGLLNSADGQVELLYNLLNWAKIQTGRMTYTPAVFGLTAQLRSDLVLIQNMAENKGITLNISIPKDALITGDSNMLITVLRNLLTNAVKFTASGGTVTLSVEPSGGGKYAFIVSDTGVGMSKEQICNLFRLDSAHFDRGTAGEQGSGLGLIVCRELIEKHGNRLRVESEKGKGSRFWFEV